MILLPFAFLLLQSLFGLGILPRGTQNRAEWTRLRERLQVFIPDEQDAEAAADLQIALRQRGRQLVTVDALVAVVALRYGLTLLRTDRDFIAIPNLKYENWMQRYS